MGANEGSQRLDMQPHNADAERAALGALLIDPDAILSIRDVMDVRDLYIERHRWLYGAYLAAVDNGNEAPSYIELCDILDQQGKLEDIGGAAFITSLINKTPTAMNAVHYAKIVADTAYLRRAISAAQKIAQIGYADDGAPIQEKQEQIERLVFDLAPSRNGDGLTHASVTVSEVYDDIDRRAKGAVAPGVKTGYHGFDAITGGLQKSDLIIIAARPSMGKTALMMGIAKNAAKMHHKNVAIFSLEMSRAQLIQRLIASETGIDSKTLRTGRLNESDWPMFIQAASSIGNSGLYIDDAPAQSASQMASKLRRLIASVDIDLIVIDYLQLMRADRRFGSRYEEISQLSSDCKWLAKEFDLPVVVGSQLSRACEQRADKRPLLSDLRDSGKIEEDADIVSFIYRDDYYNENSEMPNVAEIDVAKYRNGPTGMFPLFFKKSTASFSDIELHEVQL